MVPAQDDAACIREGLQERGGRARRGTPKGVDGLVLVTHHGHAPSRAAELLHELELDGVGVLGLVHDDIAVAALELRADVRSIAHESPGDRDLVAEVDETAFAHQALSDLEGARQLILGGRLSDQGLGMRPGRIVVRGIRRDPRDGHEALCLGQEVLRAQTGVLGAREAGRPAHPGSAWGPPGADIARGPARTRCSRRSTIGLGAADDVADPPGSPSSNANSRISAVAECMEGVDRGVRLPVRARAGPRAPASRPRRGP